MSDQHNAAEQVAVHPGPPSMDERVSTLEATSLGFFDVVRLTGLGVLLSLCLVGLGYHFAAKNNLIAPTQTTKVVFLDFEAVMEVAIGQVAQRGHLSIQNTKVDAQQFQVHLSSVLTQYAQAGYVVVNKRALIEGSADADITQEVMNKLGLTGAAK